MQPSMPAHTPEDTSTRGSSIPALFSGGTNLLINGGTFAASIINHYNGGSVKGGIERLLDETVVGAFYNSAERGDPPRCHPRTRKAILKEIMDWIRTPRNRRRFIMWLSGPAGSGKTAIAQTIAEMCAEYGLLAATFFFFRSAPERNTSSKLVSTLSYQLARAIPALCNYIDRAVERDPTIFKQSITSQMNELIVKPVQEAMAHGIVLNKDMEIPQLVILDGVDECRKENEQRDILEVLERFHHELEKLPIIFLLVSRPEFTFRRKFNQAGMSSITQGLVLDKKYAPDEDIRTFLGDSFVQIRHALLTDGRHLPQLWPREEQLTYLVQKASGQFIYAATVIRYIESPRHDPFARLNVILELAKHPQNDTPFAQLDALYTLILSNVEDLQKVLHILTFMVISDDWVDDLRRTTAEEDRASLIDMHALVNVPGKIDDQLPTLHHKSLVDFLTDRSRSKAFFIDVRQGHTKIAIYILQTFLSDLENIDDVDNCIESFIQHHEKGLVTKGFTSIMASMDFPTFLSNCKGKLDAVNISWFLGCIEKSVSVEFSGTLEQQYTQWMLDMVYKYPEPFRSSFMTLICSPFAQSPTYPRSYMYDILQILLCSLTIPESDYKDFVPKFDKELLGLTNLHVNGDPVVPRHIYKVAQMIRSRTQTGSYTFTRNKCVQLVRHLVKFLSNCSRQSMKIIHIKGKTQSMADFSHYMDSDPGRPNQDLGLHYPYLQFFRSILWFTFEDAELSSFLQSIIHKWKSDESPLCKKARKNMIRYSLEYIERCNNILPDSIQTESEIVVEDLDISSPGDYHFSDTHDTDFTSESESERSDSGESENITLDQTEERPENRDDFTHDVSHTYYFGGDDVLSRCPEKHLLEDDSEDYDADSEEDLGEGTSTGVLVSKALRKKRRKGSIS